MYHCLFYVLHSDSDMSHWQFVWLACQFCNDGEVWCVKELHFLNKHMQLNQIRGKYVTTSVASEDHHVDLLLQQFST
jgi:hypothetical protein